MMQHTIEGEHVGLAYLEDNPAEFDLTCAEFDPPEFTEILEDVSRQWQLPFSARLNARNSDEGLAIQDPDLAYPRLTREFMLYGALKMSGHLFVADELQAQAYLVGVTPGIDGVVQQWKTLHLDGYEVVEDMVVLGRQFHDGVYLRPDGPHILDLESGSNVTADSLSPMQEYDDTGTWPPRSQWRFLLPGMEAIRGAMFDFAARVNESDDMYFVPFLPDRDPDAPTIILGDVGMIPGSDEKMVTVLDYRVF